MKMLSTHIKECFELFATHGDMPVVTGDMNANVKLDHTPVADEPDKYPQGFVHIGE